MAIGRDQIEWLKKKRCSKIVHLEGAHDESPSGHIDEYTDKFVVVQDRKTVQITMVTTYKQFTRIPGPSREITETQPLTQKEYDEVAKGRTVLD